MWSDRMAAAAVALVVVLVAATAGAGVAQQQPPSCASKLVPCATYLNSSSPPASCCGPLKQAVATELNCLCSLFNSPGLLKAFNIDINQALQLPKHCGITSDASICKTSGSAAPPSSSPPATAGADNKPNAATLRGLPWMEISGSMMLLLWSILV